MTMVEDSGNREYTKIEDIDAIRFARSIVAHFSHRGGVPDTLKGLDDAVAKNNAMSVRVWAKRRLRECEIRELAFRVALLLVKKLHIAMTF